MATERMLEMDNAVKVSVVVPVYNVERYLKQCLDSICNQTLKEIEVICVNDGSTDHSLSVLEEYAKKDRRFYIINKENRGYGNTMNIGFQHAKGIYIGILESDDYAEPTMLETLFNVAYRDDLDVVKANYYNYFNGTDIENERLKNYPYHKIISYKTTPDIIHLTDSIWSSLYKREFIMENNIVFNETPGASYQDTSFACSVWMHAERVEFLRDKVLHYRTDNTDSSIHAPGKVFCICEEWKRVEQLLDEYPEKRKILKKHQIAVKYAGYLYNYNRLSACYQYALLVRIEKELKEDNEKGYLEGSYFEKSVWEEIQCILKDYNEYFTNTSKDIQDERLLLCDTKNSFIYSKAVLNELRQYNTVILYGAGKIGRDVLKWLSSENIPVSCFAVSDAQHDTNIDGIPVLCLEKLSEYCKDSIVLITVKESSQYDIYRNLNRAGFKNILFTDKLLRKEIR